MNHQVSLGLSIKASSAEPLYQQIVEQLSQRIRRGALPAGFRLPPSRALADELGTHRNTVVRAYEELSASGFVEPIVGRGTFVVDQLPLLLDEQQSSAELPWQSLLSPASDSDSARRLQRLRRGTTPLGAVDLARFGPPPELMPHKALQRCINHVLRTQGARALGYAKRQGVLALREQIAKQLTLRGVAAPVENIVITTGSQQALDMVARALVSPNDRVIVDRTTYSGALSLLDLVGAQVVAVTSDEDGPSMASLRRLAGGRTKLLYLMPNCNNPTGSVITAERRRALLAWSHEAGVALVEDDYGADLELEDTSPPPHLRALDPEVIHLSTFSKNLIPALRLGFVVCPPGLLARMVTLKHTMDLGTSALLQHAMAEFLDRGYLRAHYKRIIPEYRRRRDALVAGLRRYLPDDIKWNIPQRGVVMWLQLPPDIDAEEAYDAARDCGVLVTPGTLHTVGSRCDGGLRLTYCSEPPERLRDGAKRLGKAMAKLGRKRPHSEGTAIDGV